MSESTTSKSTLEWEKPKVKEKMYRTSTSKSKLDIRTEIVNKGGETEVKQQLFERDPAESLKIRNG